MRIFSFYQIQTFVYIQFDELQSKPVISKSREYIAYNEFTVRNILSHKILINCMNRWYALYCLLITNLLITGFDCRNIDYFGYMLCRFIHWNKSLRFLPSDTCNTLILFYHIAYKIHLFRCLKKWMSCKLCRLFIQIMVNNMKLFIFNISYEEDILKRLSIAYWTLRRFLQNCLWFLVIRFVNVTYPL